MNIKLLVISVLIYLAAQTFLSVISVNGGAYIPKYGYFVVSFLIALYYYQTRKYGYFLHPRYFKKGSKINWRMLGFSVLVYYVIILLIGYILYFVGIDYAAYRFYSFLAAIIITMYFYQTYKNKNLALTKINLSEKKKKILIVICIVIGISFVVDLIFSLLPDNSFTIVAPTLISGILVLLYAYKMAMGEDYLGLKTFFIIILIEQGFKIISLAL